MNNKLDLKVPVVFEKVNTFQVDDTRFIPVKIWLMHLGENLNGSYFTKEAVELAMPSLANTPILAFIEDKKGNKDFSDHRLVLEVTEDDIKLSYKGQAIGTIPETNNAHFEKKICDDGVEREFLVVSGLLWTKWDDPIEIFERDLVKSESMELDEDFYEGHFNGNGYFEFTKFRFFGACCLGESVQPAMMNASIEVNFAINEIKLKLNQFEKFLNQSSQKEVDIDDSSKGGTEMEDNNEVVVEEVIEDVIVEEVIETVVEEQVEEIIEEAIVETVTDFSNDVTILQEKYENLLIEFNEYKNNYSTINSDVDLLVKYKNDKSAEERLVAENVIFTKFEEKIGDTEEFTELKAKSGEFSLKELEKECLCIVGLHTDFVKETKKQEVLKFSVEKDTEAEKEVYGDLFKKYLHK